MTPARANQLGFSLVELLVVTLIFVLILGAVFTTLIVAQQRYQAESQVMNSFQGASVAMDQITRDVHAAGYPPSNSFTPTTAAASSQLVALPFAWSPNYPATPCTVGSTCAPPGSYDLIVETNPTPQSSTAVLWIRYQLQGTTLYRGTATKAVGTDPATATSANLVPYLDNVMNNASAAQMALIRSTYPTMFPGNAAVPIFAYTYDPGQPSTPPNIREVNITLIVMAPNPDPRTLQPLLVTLTGQARRMNPNQ